MVNMGLLHIYQNKFLYLWISLTKEQVKPQEKKITKFTREGKN